jgi:hypothetical protein
MSFQDGELASKDLLVEVSSSIVPNVKTKDREELWRRMKRDEA